MIFNVLVSVLVLTHVMEQNDLTYLKTFAIFAEKQLYFHIKICLINIYQPINIGKPRSSIEISNNPFNTRLKIFNHIEISTSNGTESKYKVI